MSEIVRPTRDGIHGREYISTAVDIGRKLPVLSFHEKTPTSILPPLVDIPLPIIIDMPPAQYRVPEAFTHFSSRGGTNRYNHDSGLP